MVVGRAQAHSSQHRARFFACAALLAVLLVQLLLGIGAAEAFVESLQRAQFREGLPNAQEISHPPPQETLPRAPLTRLLGRESREPSRPQPRAHGVTLAWTPPVAWVSVILLLMVPVGWMAPPGFRSLCARRAASAARAE